MYDKLFDLQKNHVTKNQPSQLKDRIEKLDKIEKWILKNRNRIKHAAYKDFQKSNEETDLSEIYPVLSEIRNARKKLKKWIKPQKIERTLIMFSHGAFIRFEPKGSVLIISPWNYPFLLAIAPLISAVSAGNSAIIKPSEISVYTSSLIDGMISELFPKNEVAVILGDKDVAIELLKLPFDHIFFTGSTDVGIKIAESAAKHLTSITLELGGKSPVVIDKTANLESAAEKIAWGKFLNKGQTCIAPDYILIDSKIRKEFSRLLIKQIKKMYGENEQILNSTYPRIISEFHLMNLLSMLEEAGTNGDKILYGGKHHIDKKFLEPTLVLTSCKTCKLSEKEIFGPILPLVEFTDLQNAVDYINKRNNPLGIYIFSNSKKNIEKIINFTQSGSVGINEVVLQFGQQNLPFGGVRHSGIGRSHGYEGFKEFSNQRSYLKASRFNFTKLIYPPFTKFKQQIIEFIIKYI